eukprot:s1_g865.t1
MGAISRRVLAVVAAAALAIPAAPALAAERCDKGGGWRSAGVDTRSQTFRLEARDRSSANARGRLGILAEDWTYHDLGRSYERITKVEHRRSDLLGGTQTHIDTFRFVTEDNDILATCNYEYKVRNKTSKQGNRSETAAQIKYIGGSCTVVPEHKVSCVRNYSPDNHRLRVSITLQDQ